MTKSKTPLTKKEMALELLEHHIPMLNKLGISDPVYMPKFPFYSAEAQGQVVTFFPSELELKKDLYTEFADKNLELLSEKRELYKLRYNPYYDSEYIKKGPHPSTGMYMYYVPVSELEVIELKEEDDDFNIPDPDTDLPISQLTIADLAAILLKKPVSQKKWLNELIKS
jgi:hypothetical protein